ncbi:MAG: hypothetical protein LUG98_15275 [Tannerellaceae bacterium]|nr:hypothetical protein [Tannerellaceae bacterium]
MKKNFIYLLSLSVCILGMTACGGGTKKTDGDAVNEDAAVIAGSATRNLLTEELKMETVQFMKDMPESEIPYRIYAGEVSMNVADMGYMLPLSKASELTGTAQKARACGMYFADYNVLKATKQPVAEIEAVLVKLTTDLNISFVQNIMKDQLPANASETEFREFMKNQENKLIDAMAENDKIDVQLEMLGGMAAEYACLLANPSLVIKGDATSAGLSENMEGRIKILGDIAQDLAVYYPDLNEMKDLVLPLQEKVITVNTARAEKDSIMATRNALLK